MKRRENNFNTQMSLESVPFEHVIYAEKGIPAITLSAKNHPEMQTPIQKFSILDREMCTCRLLSVLDVLSETILQTIVTQSVRDLDVLLLTDKEGNASN